MADGDQITKEEYATWEHPQIAIRRVAKAMQGDWGIAAASIVRRLKLGRLRAHFESGIVERAGKKNPLKPYAAIPSAIVELWAKINHLSQAPFWVSGEAEISTQAGYDYRDGENQWSLLGIRFEPSGIDDLIPGHAPPPAAPAPSGPPVPSAYKPVVIEAPEKPDSRKPVPQAALDRWAKVFVGVHTDFDGDFAQRSAEAMFPENRVGRDRVAKAITDLTGPRTRGPKKTIPQGK